MEKKYNDYLTKLNLNWIITTNYDLLIENILIGKSLSLGPKDQLLNPRGIIPVYHLHGTRLDPDSIVITQEDYISLFRPNDYRQQKLPLLIKESTTLLIGYGLGDVNVLTALDWSKNVFKNNSSINYPNDIIQLLYTETPNKTPYYDRNGVIIIETNNISKFLEQLCHFIDTKNQEFERNLEEIKKLNEKLSQPSNEMIIDFIDSHEKRTELIKKLSEYDNHLISGFTQFINLVIVETKIMSMSNGAFYAYNDRLNIILDILIAFEVEKMQPSLFSLLASSLEELAPYIGHGHGYSWAAYETWNKRKTEIPKRTICELKSFITCKRWTSGQLERLL